MADVVGKKGKKRRRKSRALVGAAPSSGGSRLTKAKELAMSEKHTLTALGAAVALGLAERQGWKIPALPMIGPAATYGLGAWVLAKYTGNKMASHAATGLLSVAAYKLASGASAPGAAAGGNELMGADELLGDGDSISGEF